MEQPPLNPTTVLNTPGESGWVQNGIAAFKAFVPSTPNPGPAPNNGNGTLLRFIPPLALFNDASQWVDLLHFVRPIPALQTPDSMPPLAAQYFTPPPIYVSALSAGQANLQQQLGNVDIQAARLTTQAANYYGG